MNTQVVLITGGPDRHRAGNGPRVCQGGAHLVVSGRRDEEGKSWSLKSAPMVRKRSSSAPMYAAKKTCAT